MVNALRLLWDVFLIVCVASFLLQQAARLRHWIDRRSAYRPPSSSLHHNPRSPRYTDRNRR